MARGPTTSISIFRQVVRGHYMTVAAVCLVCVFCELFAFVVFLLNEFLQLYHCKHLTLHLFTFHCILLCNYDVFVLK